MQEHLNKKLMKSKTNLVYIFIAMIISKNFQASLWYSLAGFSPSASSFSLLTDFSPLSLATSLVELSVSASFSSISVYIWIYPHTHTHNILWREPRCATLSVPCWNQTWSLSKAPQRKHTLTEYLIHLALMLFTNWSLSCLYISL